MLDREDQVKDALADTYSWILKDEDCLGSQGDTVSFTKWCQSDSQLYWIKGKAGSGKSTLMKYICQRVPLGTVFSDGNGADNDTTPPRCQRLLQTWAGVTDVVVASFYFWASGASLQSSRMGLYRTLLYDLLQSKPEVIPRVSPDRWAQLCVFNTDLSPFEEEELRIMLHRAIREICLHAKTCIFIDGLDEFEGDSNELIQLAEQLMMDNTNLKMCVASRPWLAFEKAFQNKPHLMLHNLTARSMKSFIDLRFRSSSHFRSIRDGEPKEFAQLIDAIVTKAEVSFSG
jgi:hypothetical protein